MLVGIARLAAESPLLEAKRQVEYFQLPSRSVLNRVKDGMPFTWAINPYRGCEFACRYCYARYTHEFMGLEEPEQFDNQIYAKQGVADLLRRDLRKAKRGESIAIGTATDPYQPAERRYGNTRAVLEVFAGQSGRRISITTKSDLITRDLDLLVRISAQHRLMVNITVTSLDSALARILEPRAPRPDLRLEAARCLSAAGIATGVFACPVIPCITDGEGALEAVAEAAAGAGARSFGGGAVFLRPCAQKAFFPFLEEHFPHLLEAYQSRFTADPYIRGAYVEKLQSRMEQARQRYGLKSSWQPDDPAPWPIEPEQMSLF